MCDRLTAINVVIFERVDDYRVIRTHWSLRFARIHAGRAALDVGEPVYAIIRRSVKARWRRIVISAVAVAFNHVISACIGREDLIGERSTFAETGDPANHADVQNIIVWHRYFNILVYGGDGNGQSVMRRRGLGSCAYHCRRRKPSYPHSAVDCSCLLVW